jgi:peptidoglycan hydrolase-like protein with peptidoglycan-binding domain
MTYVDPSGHYVAEPGGSFDTIEYGDKGYRVTQVQNGLNVWTATKGQAIDKYLPFIKADGDFGPKTKESVNVFKNVNGIYNKYSSNGIVDQITWNALKPYMGQSVSGTGVEPKPPTVQGTGKTKDGTRALARLLIGNPVNAYITQHPGWLTRDIFYAAGFVRDRNGVYHTRPDCWQQVGGYNDFYDTVFDYATSMAKAKFPFTSSDGTEYILWAWKGNYLNLGAGAEMGIYSNNSGILGQVDVTSPNTDHWLVDTSLAMPMTMTLKYKGETIISYDPSKDKDYPYDKVWWINGFNPYYQGKLSSDLTAIYTITFNTQGMYNDFYNKYGQGEYKDSRWTFEPTTLTGRFEF